VVNILAWALPINPEPWAIGKISAIRTAKGAFPKVAPHKPLVTYQEAVAESLKARGAEVVPGLYSLRFTFSHQLEVYKTRHGAQTRNAADATNMQKATEDALQGVVIGNDRDVIHIESQMHGPQRTSTFPFVIIECKFGLEWNKTTTRDWNIPGEFLSPLAMEARNEMMNDPILMPNIVNNTWKP